MRLPWIAALLIVGCVSPSEGTNGSGRKAVTAAEIVNRLSPDVAWANTTSVDINCDGRSDEVFVGSDATKYYVAAVLAPVTARTSATYVTFSLSGNSQDSFCGAPEPLAEESLDVDLVEILGDEPEGWERSPTCKGLRLEAGECDSFHIFWNRNAKRLDWWRL